jgi:hypothetical protein
MDWLQICWLCWSYSNLGLKEANFCDLKDFDDFEAPFQKMFTDLRYIGFTKSGAPTVIFTHALNALKHLDSRFLLDRTCVPNLHIIMRRKFLRGLFCITHTLLLSMNWFRSNVGGMMLIVWNSLMYCLNKCAINFLNGACRLPCNGMNEGKVSLFHVFHGSGPMYWCYRCKQLARISGNRGFRVTSMLFADYSAWCIGPIHCLCTSWCQCIHVRRCVY